MAWFANPPPQAFTTTSAKLGEVREVTTNATTASDDALRAIDIELGSLDTSVINPFSAVTDILDSSFAPAETIKVPTLWALWARWGCT